MRVAADREALSLIRETVEILKEVQCKTYDEVRAITARSLPMRLVVSRLIRTGTPWALR